MSNSTVNPPKSNEKPAEPPKVSHTPGPWSYTDDRRGIYEIIHDGDMLAQVWRVRPGCDGDLPAEANARLMAAAPELLAACKQMVRSLNGSPNDFRGMLAAHRALDAAIAKADGRAL